MRLSSKWRQLLVRAADPQGDSYLKCDPLLGWTLRSGAHSGIYAANSAGLRGLREYAEDAPGGVIRVAAFGDSFTHGAGEDNASTWPASLERLDAGIEALNYGVDGYGVDQAFLRYQEDGERFHPRVVVVALIADDIGRQLSTYRPFKSPGVDLPFAKPRFVPDGDGLRLIPSPLSDTGGCSVLAPDDERLLHLLGANDFFFKIGYFEGPFDRFPSVRLGKIALNQWARHGLLDSGSEAMTVTTRLLLDFERLATKRGSRFLVMFLPEQYEIARFQKEGSRRYTPLIDALRPRGVSYLDLMETFAATGDNPGRLFNSENHYSAAGNGLVAQALQKWLRSLPTR